MEELVESFRERIFVVLGNGNREAAIALRLAEEGCRVAMVPGNAAYHFGKGRIQYDSSHPGVDPFRYVMGLKAKGDLACVIVGPEEYLDGPMVDLWRLHGIPVIGPTRANAELELSKWFFYQICVALGIRTPLTQNAYHDENIAKLYAQGMIKRYGSVVVKVDGRTGARGVKVCKTVDEAWRFIELCLKKIEKGDWKGDILLQQPIKGREVSYTALTGCKGVNDERMFVELPPYRDHKLTPDGEMCGGLGGFSPVPDVSDVYMVYFRNAVVHPILARMRLLAGLPYTGFVFVGGIIDENGDLWIIEWNARAGDPEILAILPLIKTPLWRILEACIEGEQIEIDVDTKKKVGVMVLAAPGYPADPKVRMYLHGVEKLLAEHPHVRFIPGGLDCRSSTSGGRIEDLTVASGRAFALVAEAATWSQVDRSLRGACEVVQWVDRDDVAHPFIYRPDMFQEMVERDLAWST